MTDEVSPLERPAVRSASRRADMFAGGSLGALLGLLMGFTTSPVASIVVTGIVALLAGFFGLSDKLSLSFSAGAARRLTAFGVAAVLMIPAAIWMRAHEILGPSVQQQKLLLNEIGISGADEQKQMLRYLRFGLLPSGVVANAKDVPPVAGGKPFLYSISASFCNELSKLQALKAPVADFEMLFATSGEEYGKIGTAISALPAEKKMTTFNAAPTYLCTR